MVASTELAETREPDHPGLGLDAQSSALPRSVISAPTWRGFSSAVTVVTIGAALVLGVSVGLAGPAVSPVAPLAAAAVTATSDDSAGTTAAGGDAATGTGGGDAATGTGDGDAATGTGDGDAATGTGGGGRATADPGDTTTGPNDTRSGQGGSAADHATNGARRGNRQ